MGRHFGTGQEFLGVPVVKARNALKAWRHTGGDAVDVCDRKDVGLEAPVVAMLLQEFEDRGLIGPEAVRRKTVLGLTDAGKAFVTASGRRRVPREKAQGTLDALLERCAAVNADRAAPYHVDQVWLYGSMVRGEPAVGDVDVVVTKRWSPEYWAVESLGTREAKAVEYASAALGPGVANGIHPDVSTPATLFERSVFGQARNPLLSPGREADLIRLACPCRLVFDAEFGGRVDAPVLDMHPDATGRDPAVGEQVAMPPLGPAEGPLRPVHARYLRSVDLLHGRNGRLGIFPADDNGFFHVVQAHRGARAWVATDRGEVAGNYKANRVSKALAKAGLDGRGLTGHLLAGHGGDLPVPEAGILMRRGFEEDGDRVSYRVGLDVLVEREPRYFEMANALLPAMALAAADVARAVRRDAERGGRRPIAVEVEVTGDAAEMVESLVGTAVSHPANWLGSNYEADLVSVTVGGTVVLGEDRGAPRP